MVNRTTILVAVLVFLALAGGLAAYLLVGQDSEPTAEEAKQESAANPETTAEAEQPTTAESTDGEETTQEDTNSAAQYDEATVEETDPVDETNLAEASPQEVLALYYRYLNEQAWEEAYGLLSSQSQQRVSPEQFVAKWQETSAVDYSIEEYSISPVEVQDDLATLQVELTVAAAGLTVPGQSSTRQMVREDGGWRLVLSDEEVASYTGAEPTGPE